MDQNQRLVVAARVKAIADSGDTFDARWADGVAKLLGDDPVHRFFLEVRSTFQGGGTTGHSPGFGDVSVPGDKKTASYSFDDRTVRCGANVIEKLKNPEFDIRHVMEIDADEKASEILKLIHTGIRWEARINRPRMFTIGILRVTAGQRFDLWKVGGWSGLRGRRRTADRTHPRNSP